MFAVVSKVFASKMESPQMSFLLKNSGAEVETNLVANTHIVDPVLGKPVETLEEEQKCEECDEPWGEVIAEHCEGKTRLSNGVPGLLYQVLQHNTCNAYLNSSCDAYY